MEAMEKLLYEARNAKTVLELEKMANAVNIALTPEQLQQVFGDTHSKREALSDDALENVAGGYGCPACCQMCGSSNNVIWSGGHGAFLCQECYRKHLFGKP